MSEGGEAGALGQLAAERARPTPPAVTPEPKDPLGRPMRALLLVGCLVILSLSHRVDPDLWGHVRYGREALAAHALPASATHTYTAEGHPWINHENLAELVFGWIDLHLGAAGLTAFTSLLGLLMLGLMVRNATRQGVSFLVLWLVTLLAALVISPGWTVRPQVFTYTFFTLLIVILSRCFGAGGETNTRALWLTPPLFALWANAHGGFLAGLAVLALYLGCRGLVALWSRGRNGWGEVGTYAGVLTACGLATFANPYGPRLVTWLIADLIPPRPEIGEWHPLASPDPSFFIFAALLSLTVVAWVGSRRPRDLGQVAVLVVMAWQSLRHARHPPFFGILAGFWLPFHLEGLRLRGRKGVRERASVPPSARAVRVLRGVTWATALLLLVTLGVQSRTLWVSRAYYPVDAVQYMADRHLGGKLVVGFNWAQYALAALAPGTRVAFDGRLRTCYPQDVADLYFDFLLGSYPDVRWRSPTSPPFDDTAILRVRDPDLVLLGRRSKHAVKVMQRRSGWVLLYQDHVAQVWGRPERYGDPAGPDYVPPAVRSIGDRLPRGWVRWPAFPTRPVVTGVPPSPSRQYPAAAITGTESWRLAPSAVRSAWASGCETIVAAQTAATPPRQSASSRCSPRRSSATSTSSERS